MGLIKGYFENYWATRLLVTGIALIVLGIFFIIKVNQLLAGIIILIIGIILIILSIGMIKFSDTSNPNITPPQSSSS